MQRYEFEVLEFNNKETLIVHVPYSGPNGKWKEFVSKEVKPNIDAIIGDERVLFVPVRHRYLNDPPH